DLAEARSYVEYFGEHGEKIPVTSPKSALGDMCEAAGVVGAILALEAFRTGEVPPTLNFRGGDEWSARLGVRGEPQACTIKRAVVTSRNLFGLCGSLVLAEA